MKKIVVVFSMLFTLIAMNAKSHYPTADVEKHDIAVLVIDMQNDFVDPKESSAWQAQKPLFRLLPTS